MATLVPDRFAEAVADQIVRIRAALGATPPVADPWIALDGIQDNPGAMALIVQLTAELAKARQAAADLALALETNREIGAATGILMALHHVTQPEAFDLLRMASQSRHVKLRSVAREVVETGALPVSSPASGPPDQPRHVE